MSAWTNSNLEGMSEGHLRDMLATGRQIVAKHGLDPCTKAQAAAHEAGHVVVARAMGETILGARIWQDGKYWLGMNKRDSGLANEAFFAHERPLEAFRGACNLLAGIAGEDFAGHYHASSSIDEREKARSICAVLDDVAGKPEGMTQQHAAEVVHAILTRYRSQFDTVRAHLMQRRRLTTQDANRMLAKVGAL